VNQYKTCRVCKAHKVIADFSKCSRSIDLLNSRCRQCAKNYYQRNRDKILEQKTVYYQQNIERLAEYKKTYYEQNGKKLNAQKREMYAVDSEAKKARNRNWARNNREKLNAYYRKYAAEKPHIIRKKRLKRRIRMMDNGVFEVSKRDIKKLLSNKCVFCGKSGNITIDHVIPLARGGRHSVGNLMALCWSCNASKQDKTFMEFRLAKMVQAEMKL